MPGKIKDHPVVQIRLPKSEKEQLDLYCEKHMRTATDLLREFIRSLPKN
jgi:predicted DNA-binding protein